MKLHEQRLPKKTLKNKVDIRCKEKLRRNIQTMKVLTLAASTAGSVRRTMNVLATTNPKHLLRMKMRRSLAYEQEAALPYPWGSTSSMTRLRRNHSIG
jgi:hypothetical protein